MRFDLFCSWCIFFAVALSVDNVKSQIGPNVTFDGPFLNLRYEPVTVDVVTKDTKKCPPSTPITFEGYYGAPTFLINTGVSIQTNDQRRTAAKSYGGPLKGVYNYLSFQYYWASNTSAGVTGTTIDKKSFPYVVRDFYINSKYTNFTEAIKHEDGFVDYVFLFTICSRFNKAFEKVSQAIRKIPKAGSFTYVPFGVHIDGIHFLSPKTDYYTYTGNFFDKYTGKNYPCLTVVIFKPNSGFCITQEQFDQTFNIQTNFFGKPFANSLTHDSSKMRPALCRAGVTQTLLPI
ncbi:carbonic anhydrase 2-like [Planococcus citri]|uniref:carbonic anhydrase 2-like n=1 Tax=Planococcus citri TaxID=170843 RepID=UPI0031F73712